MDERADADRGDELSEPHRAAPAGRGGSRVDRLDVVDVRGLRTRIEHEIEDALLIFELDRMIYEIEVDAQRRWLRTLQRFEAYCAERDRRSGGPGTPPVR